MRHALVLSLFVPLCACSLSRDLPTVSPRLADMEEPLDLRREPDDEAQRTALPVGSFSGLVVEDARDTLAQKLDEPSQLRVLQVVENSPAMAAGFLVDDVLIEVGVGNTAPVPLLRESEWRQIELANAPGTEVTLLVDRAGREAKGTMVLAPRLRPPPRIPTATFREEDRVGVVFRTATEVEARSAGLAPGGGAVVIGMSRSSPWRPSGIRLHDLLVALDGAPLAHPEDLQNALREEGRESMQLDFVRDGERRTVEAPLSRRVTGAREFSIPLVFSYEHDRGVSEWSAILSIFQYRSTKAAWRFRLFWVIRFGGGDEDQLLEAGS
ncbi:MAG: PDZ domain-containing protein [Planctomycetota bacterium]